MGGMGSKVNINKCAVGNGSARWDQKMKGSQRRGSRRAVRGQALGLDDVGSDFSSTSHLCNLDQVVDLLLSQVPDL